MNIRELALKLFSEWERDGKYINLTLSSHSLDNATREERAALTALLYTAVERKITVDYYIASVSGRSVDKISPRVRNILRLGISQIVYMNSIPDFAAVNESVKLAKSAGERSFVNGVLRELVRRKEAGALPLPPREKNAVRHLSVKYSYPAWLVRHFIAELGEDEAEALLSYMNSDSGVDLTVNTNKISRTELLSKIKESGVSAAESELSEISIKISGSHDPRSLFGYSEGLFFVQDEASAIAALVLDPKAGELIIDSCSAPGGKSFAAAILSADSASIRSFDIHESKLSLISGGAARLGLSSVSAEICDAAVGRAEYFGKADKVICDVPCSGLGVIAKKSDIRYKSEDDVKALPSLQLDILRRSAEYLRPGGTLVYSTCTLSTAENRDVVTAFLGERLDFELVPFEIPGLSAPEGYITLYPHRTGTDGFFIAKIRKKK